MRHPLSSASALVPVLIGVFAGLVGGTTAGYLVQRKLVARINDIEAQTQQIAAASSTRPVTVPQIQLVPVEQRPSVPATPSTLLTRRQSLVLPLVKREVAKAGEGYSVVRDHGFASAVALTSDGWLVTDASVFSGLKVSDLQVVWQNRLLPIERAIKDQATGVVFLKTSATGLPVTALVRSVDVTTGMVVWVETRPKRLLPDTIIDHRLRVLTEPVSSERVSRRFMISFTGDVTSRGSAVWDADGQLIGILSARLTDGWSVLPASAIASDLSSLLSTQEIRHASLGVRAFDLSGVASSQLSLPTQGAWIKGDKTSAAVSSTGPAAGLLKEGDVIERVERDILDGTADLGERLLEYRPGTTVQISGQRDGQPFEEMIRLGSVVTSEVLK